MCNLLSRKTRKGTSIDKKRENAEYLGSMITNDTKFTREIKSRIAMTQGALNK
jgi:hypothetical protein